MKPTIGRTVYYTDALHHTRAAIITQVHHDEETVDLAVLWPDRMEFRTNVKHDTDHELKTWDWMPHQKQQQIDMRQAEQLLKPYGGVTLS